MSTAGSIERGYSAAVPAREGVRREGGTEYGVGPRVVRQRDHPVQPRPADSAATATSLGDILWVFPFPVQPTMTLTPTPGCMEASACEVLKMCGCRQFHNCEVSVKHT